MVEKIITSSPNMVELTSSLEDRIEEIVTPALSFRSFMLVDVHQSRQRLSHQIRLTIHHENGVSVSDLADIHKIIYPRLTVMLGHQDISLELSSPGINYVFKRDYDYTIFNGQQVRLLRKSDNLWRHGTLIDHDEQDVVIKDEMGNVERYAKHDVFKVVLNSNKKQGANS